VVAKPVYEFSNTWKAWKGGQDRLTQFEMSWDPWTIRNLDKICVQSGWHCLEVAGGGGSIAAWLCQQVGADGYVMATDLETCFLNNINTKNLDVRAHDIRVDCLPKAAFDLVHTRALLAFLPEPSLSIRELIAALKPGGWLLIEEPDYVSAVNDPSMEPKAAALSAKGWSAILTAIRMRGCDTEFGRHLYGDVAAYGLTNLHAEGFVAVQLGGTPPARFWRMTLEQLQEEILAHGLLSASEIDLYCALLESPQYRSLSVTMMSVWGQRPEQRPGD
jgi:ubiquinone/menaquinone biosynthesis C-methylase UbiE